MLAITEMLLSNHNRPRKKMVQLKGIVVHWTSNTNRGADAVANRNYFNTTHHAASAHYIVDDKRIIRCIPDDEIAYHVGAGRYTSLGNSMRSGKHSPNFFLIGIEMCVNNDGDWRKTYQATVELAAYLLRKHNLTADSLYRHFDITGKECPKMMLEEKAWNAFKVKITNEMIRIKVVVNGKRLNTSPVLKNDTVYVPIHDICEALSADVEWDEINYTLNVKSRGIKLKT